MIDLDRYQKAFAALPKEIQRAEVNAERVHRTILHIRDGKTASSESFDITKYYLRAGGDHLGMIYTERGDEDTDTALRQAAENAKWTSKEGIKEPMNAPGINSPEEGTLPEASFAELISLGAETEKILNREAFLQDLAITVTERETRTVNSLGLDIHSRDGWTEIETRICLPRKGTQDAEAETNMSGKTLSDLNPRAFAEKAISLAQGMDGNGLPAIRISEGCYDCVMTGQVLRNILMTAWRAFSAETMQSGASCFHGIGEQVGSPAVTIINGPVHPLSGKRWPLDSEGTYMRETVPVRKGVISEPLYTLRSAATDGAQSNGCAGRVPCMTGNVPIVLTTVPGIMYLQPKNGVSQEELIRQMGSGIVLTYSLDLYHSVNLASGSFSVPCGGWVIRDGKPVGSVSQMTVAGSLKELFSAMEAVADDLDFDDFYFRNYCIGSPSALLQGMRFST